MAFTGFLSSQIIWGFFNSNAETTPSNKEIYSVYEKKFQTLKLTMENKKIVEPRLEKSPIVILNFWASWCVPCLKEFPSLVEFQDKYKGKVKVFGINGDSSNSGEMIKKIKKQYKLNFESAEDPHEWIGDDFNVQTYPVSLVFHQGKMIYESKKFHNFMDKKFLELIDSALKVEK